MYARPHLMRVVLMGLSGLVLSWQILTLGLSNNLAETQPERSLFFKSNPNALLQLADQQLNGKPEATQAQPAAPPNSAATASSAIGARTAPTDAIAALARRALHNDPMNARAYRILAQLAELGGDEARADVLMQAAFQHSKRESYASYWLAHKAGAQGDFTRAVELIDGLLRVRPQLTRALAPFLLNLVEAHGKLNEIMALLDNNPDWRRGFLEQMIFAASNPRTPLTILLRLKDTALPPLDGNVAQYINYLVGHTNFEVAYETWLLFLPVEQLSVAGRLFNGKFEVGSAGSQNSPFDWKVAAGPGVVIDYVQRPGVPGDRALLLEFQDRRAEFPGVTQTTLLVPGQYKLKGQMHGAIKTRRGLRWSIRCLTKVNSPPIAMSNLLLGQNKNWERFEFVFTVPDSNCRAQEVKLSLDARSASDQFTAGSIMFDDLEIEREK